jgi:hypothetical protein
MMSPMSTSPEPTCLVIADISGYTTYLVGVELDHAQDILGDLTDTVVRSLRPTFRLAKLEGDAAFMYAVVDGVDGSLLQDTIEGTYFAFRRRLRDIGQASLCECAACIRIPALDLKLVVHHGPVARQRMAGREELVGREVIVVHRLLKNSVEESSGMRAYALYTQACMEAIGVDPLAQGLREHRETIDIIGEVVTWLRDLGAAWQEEQERTRVEVTAAEAYAVVTADTPAPPQLVWEYITSPARRPQWAPGTDRIDEMAPAGRRGVGTTNHCIHGKDAIIEEVLDWRPYAYWTTRGTMPRSGMPKLVNTDALIPLPDGGTRIEVRVGRPKPRDKAPFEELWTAVEPMVRSGLDALLPVLAEEAAKLPSEAATGPPREPGAVVGRTVDSGGVRSSSG